MRSAWFARGDAATMNIAGQGAGAVVAGVVALRAAGAPPRHARNPWGLQGSPAQPASLVRGPVPPPHVGAKLSQARRSEPPSPRVLPRLDAMPQCASTGRRLPVREHRVAPRQITRGPTGRPAHSPRPGGHHACGRPRPTSYRWRGDHRTCARKAAVLAPLLAT